MGLLPSLPKQELARTFEKIKVLENDLSGHATSKYPRTGRQKTVCRPALQ